MQPNKQNTVRGITLVPSPSKKHLNEKQEVDYRSHRRHLIRWALTKGKEPSKAKGYSEDTIRVRAGHLDRFYRWVWTSAEEAYTTKVTHAHADSYMDHLAFREDLRASTKSKYQKSVKMLFQWRSNKYNQDEWDPEMTFTEPNSTQPADYLSLDERGLIREASLSMSGIPHYKSVTPDERERWKKHIAVILNKPLDSITKNDWEEINGWKETSLIHVSLDAGLRPCEVARATLEWFDDENDVLRIPKDESSKNRDNWTIALTDRSSETLNRWIAERECYSKYDDTDLIWLTRRSNPYSSSSLTGVLERACDEAGISTEHRDMTWYSIRHSVGTYMTRAEGLAAAKEQLRHKSETTTMKYDRVPVEDRQSALDSM